MLLEIPHASYMLIHRKGAYVGVSRAASNLVVIENLVGILQDGVNHSNLPAGIRNVGTGI